MWPTVVREEHIEAVSNGETNARDSLRDCMLLEHTVGLDVSEGRKLELTE